MEQAYVLTGELRDGRSLVLDEAVPLAAGKVGDGSDNRRSAAGVSAGLGRGWSCVTRGVAWVGAAW